MKIKIYITGFFYFVTLNAQSNMDNIIIEGEKYNLGGFFNIADDGIDKNCNPVLIPAERNKDKIGNLKRESIRKYV